MIWTWGILLKEEIFTISHTMLCCLKHCPGDGSVDAPSAMGAMLRSRRPKGNYEDFNTGPKINILWSLCPTEKVSGAPEDRHPAVLWGTEAWGRDGADLLWL